MTEDQKYQGTLYKNKKSNTNKKVRINPPNAAEEESSNLFHPTPVPPITASSSTTTTAAAAAEKSKKTAVSTPRAKKSKMATVAQLHNHVSHAAYVEDVPEELEAYLVADDDDNASRSDDDNALPHAPTPPPVAEGNVNVFDFLVGGPTPNASALELAPDGSKLSDSNEVVRYQYDVNAFLDSPDFAGASKHHLVQYGSGPVPSSGHPYQTPAHGGRSERRKKDSAADKEAKKDKKRKRLYLDINDQVMTDAPPVLHSGLTGGLNRLTTKHPDFPPSPDSAEIPTSPLKKSKSKHSKSSKTESIGSSLFSLLTAAGSKPKTKKRKNRSVSPSGKKHHHHRHRHSRHRVEKESQAKPAQKLLEFPTDKVNEEEASGQMIVYKPRADLFLSFVNKGPESERGCSMNKALKRFHRERTSAGTPLGKTEEEKELFRSLRLRKNDRGEIVLFCPDD